MNERTRAQPVLSRLAPITRVFHRVALVLLREDVGGQGPHIDPEDPTTDPPSTARWTTTHRRAVGSPNMSIFRDGLRPPRGGREREGVLEDLGLYYHLPPDEVLKRCLNWETVSVEEWEAARRDTPAGIADFYATTQSWSFDLMWYCYLQSTGFGYPKSVVIADRLKQPPGLPAERPRLLDFGSGVGVTAQLFAALGYDVTLADVSAPLLEFARWRLQRRGVSATYLHLPAQLTESAYDLITALDVMVHIPTSDLDEVAHGLHRALRRGGLFITGYDVRRRSRASAWHLYDDDLALRWAVERAGFVPVDLVNGNLWIYRAVPTNRLAWRMRTVLAWVRLASPPARALRRLRRAAARAALLTFYRLVGIKRADEESEKD